MKKPVAVPSVSRRTALALALSGLFASGVANAAAGDRIGDEIAVDTAVQEDQPAVARDSAGQFVVVWNNTSLISARLYAADGTAAGPPFTVAQPGGNPYALTYAPHVAMRADGGFVVTWTVLFRNAPQYGVVTSPKYSIHARRYAPGGAPIGDEFLVADLGNRSAVAMDDDGDFVIGWAADGREKFLQFPYPGRSFDLPGGGVASIKLQRFNADGTAVKPVQTLNERLVSRDAPTSSIAVAMTPDGAFTAVYSLKKTLSSTSNIYAQSFGADGRASGKTFQVNDTLTDSGGAIAASSRSGDLIVAWNDASGAQYKSYTRTGAVRLPQVKPFGDVTTASYSPSALAIDPNGDFVIAGGPPIAKTGNVVSRFFRADGAPLSSTNGVAPGSEIQVEPAVAMDGQGNAVFAWTRYVYLPNIDAIESEGIGAQRLAGP